jgi:hypothetical protein
MEALNKRQEAIRKKEELKKRKQKLLKKRYRSKAIEDYLLQQVYAILYN